MPAGRPPKFPAIKRIEGNRAKVAKHYIEDQGVKAFGDVMKADYAPEDAKFAFDLIQQSLPYGILTKADTFIVNNFCIAFAVNKRATKRMFEDEESDDNFITSKIKGDGETVGPWWKIFCDSARLMSQLGSLIGLDPRARQQMMQADNVLDNEDLKDLIG